MTLAPKLTDEQTNEASSWLPGSAESTRALAASEAFSSPNMIPAVVVYERDSGITEPEMAKASADAEAFGQLEGLGGDVEGACPLRGRPGPADVRPARLGEDGWELSADVVADMRKQRAPAQKAWRRTSPVRPATPPTPLMPLRASTPGCSWPGGLKWTHEVGPAAARTARCAVPIAIR